MTQAIEVGDFVVNIKPHPGRDDLPIQGTVLRIHGDIVVFQRDKSIATEGNAFYPAYMADFARVSQLSVIRKVEPSTKMNAPVTEEPVAITPQEVGTFTIINLNHYKSRAILDDPDVVYLGRYMRSWRGAPIPASPLANPFPIRQGMPGGSAIEVVERCDREIIQPAVEKRSGPVWDEISRLAELVRSGRNIKGACWCVDEAGEGQCHGHPVAIEVLSLACEVNP